MSSGANQEEEMKDTARDISRITSVVSALKAEVSQGYLTWATGPNGVQIARVDASPMPMGQPNPYPFYVLQGNNVFTFGPDEQEAAEDLAAELNAAFADFSKSYRRKAVASLSEILGEPAKTTTKKKS
jgi:hypothetical protein